MCLELHFVCTTTLCVKLDTFCKTTHFVCVIGKFYTWLNFFTQPAVVMVVTNMKYGYRGIDVYKLIWYRGIAIYIILTEAHCHINSYDTGGDCHTYIVVIQGEAEQEETSSPLCLDKREVTKSTFFSLLKICHIADNVLI